MGNRELQVLFEEVFDLDQNGNPISSPNSPRRTNPMGPFSSISCGARLIVGTVHSNVSQDINRAERFHYRLYENGIPVTMKQTSLVNFNGGGIDIPRTPP